MSFVLVIIIGRMQYLRANIKMVLGMALEESFIQMVLTPSTLARMEKYTENVNPLKLMGD